MGFKMFSSRGISWFLLCGLIQYVAAQVFRTVPSDRETKSGETITLECAVTSEQTCNVLWYRPNIQTYISDGTSILRWVRENQPNKFSVVGNATRGEYFLRISNVTVEDAGKYQCSCGSVSKRMELKVVQPPLSGYPQCTIEGGMTTIFAGDLISLTCVSKGGMPPASLTWYHNGVASDNMVHHGNNMVQVRYVTYAAPLHQNSLFVCTAESPALAERRNCTIGPLTILSPLAMVSSLESGEPMGMAENYAVMDADEMEGNQGSISFTCGLKPNFTSDAVQNTTWFVNGEVVIKDTKDFGVTDRGQTLYLKEDSLMKGEVEVSCQVNVDGRSLGNITRLVEITGPTVNDLGNTGGKGRPDRPIIYETNDDTPNVIDIRPLILLNACIILIMLLLILVAVYSPKVCNCRSPVYQHPKPSKPVKQSSRRHADSRITELHFVQSEQCQNGVAHCEGSHFYETPNSPNQVSLTSGNNAPPLPPTHVHSSQEMQATFHVVVHSRNGGPMSQTTNHHVTNETPAPQIATVTPVNSSNTSNNNSGSVCCVYAPVRKKSKGNVYTQDKANLQSHYQRVTGPPRVAEHLLHPSLPAANLHENPLCNGQIQENDFHSLTTSPCSTLPSNSKLAPSSPMPMAYSRTLPPTPLECKEDLKGSVSCGDVSEDDLDSIYANIASLEDIFKQTSI
ncbi:uncharacterized protein [Apostichopus japonicus]|uniref:uncharacterized protein n=1 Tax=Stichopus japonicus TaxID=307972 RepID=UPI003AB3066C